MPIYSWLITQRNSVCAKTTQLGLYVLSIFDKAFKFGPSLHSLITSGIQYSHPDWSGFNKGGLRVFSRRRKINIQHSLLACNTMGRASTQWRPLLSPKLPIYKTIRSNLAANICLPSVEYNRSPVDIHLSMIRIQMSQIRKYDFPGSARYLIMDCPKGP